MANMRNIKQPRQLNLFYWDTWRPVPSFNQHEPPNHQNYPVPNSGEPEPPHRHDRGADTSNCGYCQYMRGLHRGGGMQR
jgi:hypothetical protein